MTDTAAIRQTQQRSDSPTAATSARLRLDDFSAEELDQLPYGAIELDLEGVILKFNQYESKLSGLQKERAIGKHFFTEVAPCANVQEFYGRFLNGVAKKTLHEKFRYHFAFKQNPRDVTVTLFYSDKTASVWVFVRPV